MRIQSGNSISAGPIYALLQIIRKDSQTFFQNLEAALDDIARDSVDDYLISRRLENWRKLMSDFEIEVPAMKVSLHEFIDIVFPAANQLPKEVRKVVSDLERDIARISQRIEKAYADLRSDMLFAESRRSIVEAESVAKITELALIFIPLSFTCSLFSMSIYELQNGVPVWTFVLTAIFLIMLSYLVRLVVTSELFANSKRTAIKTLWKGRDLPTTRKASIPAIVLLTVKEMWMNGGAEFCERLLVYVGGTAAVVLPASFV